MADNVDDTAHPGYLSDVKKERYLRVTEFVLPPEQPEVNTINLNKLIFTDEFSKDIVDRYHRQFGYTETQINIQAPNRFEDFTSYDGVRVTVEEDVARKRVFGEFMLKKLTEYHVDNFLKSNPSTKKVYEVKETISNASIKVAGGFKLKAKYSLSGNSFKLNLRNPYKITNELVYDLDSEDNNIVGHLGFPFFGKTIFNTYYDFSTDFITTILVKPLIPYMAVTLTGINSLDEETTSNQIYIGFYWRY